jgi:predicted amidohydrolase YtcJ
MLNRRQVLLSGAAFGAGLAFADPAHFARESSSEPLGQDLLIINARAMTLYAQQPEAEAILVKRGRISFVGGAAEARVRGRDLPVFDAAGRTVIPGFIDGHTHLEWFSESFSFHTQLPAELKSLQDMFAILRRAAAHTPAGHWVIGRGYFSINTQVVEKRLATRLELDAISTDHPIVLFSSVHEASLNSLAFKMLRLWTEGEEKAMRWKDGRPRIGTLISRDAAGVPTGVATEIYDLILDQPLFPFADRMAAYALHAREDYASKGLTAIVDMSGQPDHIKADRMGQNRGELPLRIRMFHIIPNGDTLDEMVGRGLKRGDGNDLYRFAGVKVFVDGDGDDGMGHEITDLKWSQQDLNNTVLRCNQVGYPMVFHVVTKGGFDYTLNALEYAERRTPRRPRHQIHHLGGLLNDATARARVKALGVVLGLTRADRGDAWPEEIDYRGLLDEGLKPLCVSDSAGSFRNFSALDGIASLVLPPSEGGVLRAGRTVSLEEGLRMWTSTPAYANYEEHNMGSISVGKLGDLSVLSHDPRMLRGRELFDLKIETVVLGGRVVFDKSVA